MFALFCADASCNVIFMLCVYLIIRICLAKLAVYLKQLFETIIVFLEHFLFNSLWCYFMYSLMGIFHVVFFIIEEIEKHLTILRVRE